MKYICYGSFCFFQAEDGIRDLVRSRGLGDVYKRQVLVLLVRRSNIASGTTTISGLDQRTLGSFTLERLSLIHI